MTEFLYKVIVIGDGKVGKTAFLDRYCNNQFNPNYKRTIGVDYQVKVIQYDNCTLRMQFWDIAGQEYSKVLSRGYYNAASACIIVFDITDVTSYNSVKEWKQEVDNKLGQIPTLILANKHDLVDDITSPKPSCVDDLDLENLKDEIQATEVFHVSAKTGYQVKSSMKLLEKILMGVTIPKPPKKPQVSLSEPRTPQPRGQKSCC